MHIKNARDIKDVRLSIINEIEYNHKNDRKDEADGNFINTKIC